MTQPKNRPSFTATDLGPLTQLDQYRFKHPALPQEVEGKVFLNQLLGLTSCEISINKLPARTSLPFYHTHRLNEADGVGVQKRVSWVAKEPA